MRGWYPGCLHWQWRRRNWRFLAEHQGGNWALGEIMDLSMFGYFRFQMKRQHFFRRLWQSDQWDLRALNVPLLFLDLRLLTFDWRSNFGKSCLASLLLRQPMMRTNIPLLDIFAPSYISCQVIFEVVGVLPLVRIQCLLPRSTAHQLMVSTRSITIPKVFRWLTTRRAKNAPVLFRWRDHFLADETDSDSPTWEIL